MLSKSDSEEVQMFYAYIELVNDGVPKDLAYWGVYGKYEPPFEDWLAENRNFMGNFKPK
jgi:hypothetical protein